MTTLTIALPDASMLRLKELATEAGIAPEELLHASIIEWLAKPNDDFAQAATYVLKKNSELYQRLAK